MKYEAIESFPVAAYLAQPGRRGRIILTFAIIVPMLIDAVARFRDWIAVLGAGRADRPLRRVPGGRLLRSLQVVALVFGFSPVTGLPGVAGRGPATAGDPQPDRRSGIAALLCRLRPAGVTGHDRVGQTVIATSYWVRFVVAGLVRGDLQRWNAPPPSRMAAAFGHSGKSPCR